LLIAFAQEKDKSLPLANEEYADNNLLMKLIIVSNSKFQIEQLHLQLRKRYLQAEPSF
jgi:hypothetical protein